MGPGGWRLRKAAQPPESLRIRGPRWFRGGVVVQAVVGSSPIAHPAGKDARGFGVFVVMSTDDPPPAGSHRPEGGPAVLRVGLPALAGTIRRQSALPLSEAEASELARSLEGPGSDEELLDNTLGMLRLVIERLELSPPMAGGDDEPGR
jgi:hypothetical protein